MMALVLGLSVCVPAFGTDGDLAEEIAADNAAEEIAADNAGEEIASDNAEGEALSDAQTDLDDFTNGGGRSTL
jgi:hypothetical protein